MLKLLIAESTGFSPVALARLREVAQVAERDLSRQQLLAALPDVDILWVRLRNRIDEEMLSAAPRLKWLVTNTTGVAHIDLEAAARRNVRVLTLRDESTFLSTIRATAELTIGLLLSLTRCLPAAMHHTKDGGWDRYPFKGQDLYGRTAGIVGYGRLGRIVGGYLAALGMRVTAATKQRDVIPEPGVTLLDLDELLPEADVVSLHVNLDATTRGMFGDAQFQQMKRGAWLVNTARGELLDESALIRALDERRIAGAALDVVAHPYDGPRPASALLEYASQHDNLLLTPHIGGYTHESLARTEDFLAEKLATLLAGAEVCR
jgi:D-3-phosphoglycerate dehydrogenase / 2-oxoglutarate reductase